MHPYSIAQVKMLEIGHTISQGVIIVTPTGWLDTASYEEFLKYCTALPAGPVILDLSNLTYISSAGLRALRQFEKGRERSRNNGCYCREQRICPFSNSDEWI